jgi:predicted DNA-binding transcriptional regulator AlpA
MAKLTFQPRIIRAKQAPDYLGMCRAIFNSTVRPYVHEFPIGQQGIGFDRLELDQWADAYIAAHSLDKGTKVRPPSPLIVNPQSWDKRRGQIMAGLAADKATYKPPTSEEFYKLVDELMGRSTDKKNRAGKNLRSTSRSPKSNPRI